MHKRVQHYFAYGLFNSCRHVYSLFCEGSHKHLIAMPKSQSNARGVLKKPAAKQGKAAAVQLKAKVAKQPATPSLVRDGDAVVSSEVEEEMSYGWLEYKDDLRSSAEVPSPPLVPEARREACPGDNCLSESVL